MQNALSRLWFLSKGCKQCPIEITIKPLWANGDEGYFLSAAGTKQMPVYSPSNRTRGKHCHNGKRGQDYPSMRHYGSKSAHRLMAYACSDEPCPTFIGKNGKPYKGIVHHLIEDPNDFRNANLLYWLDRKTHSEADRRQRALRAVLPDMHELSYDEHRRLQDPRTMSREQFDVELNQLRQHYGKA